MMARLAPRRFWGWVARRNISASEIGFTLLMAWMSRAMWLVPQAQRDAVPFYQRLEAIMPLEAWSLLTLALSLTLAAGVVLYRARIMQAAYIGICCWWSAFGAVSFSINHNALSVGFFAIFAIWSMWRALDVGLRRRHIYV